MFIYFCLSNAILFRSEIYSLCLLGALRISRYFFLFVEFASSATGSANPRTIFFITVLISRVLNHIFRKSLVRESACVVTHFKQFGWLWGTYVIPARRWGQIARKILCIFEYFVHALTYLTRTTVFTEKPISHNFFSALKRALGGR